MLRVAIVRWLVCMPIAIMVLCMSGCRTGTSGRGAEALAVDESVVLDRQVSDMLARGTAPSADVIRMGDKLIIDVWMRDRISQLGGFPLEMEMPESGIVFIPHVGNLQVSTYTPDQLQEYLQGVFSEILHDSTVIVRRSRGEPIGSGRLVGSVRGAMSIDDAAEHFVMMGSVARPGVYSLGPGLRLREALALAGGLEMRRSSRRIFIVRGSHDDPEVIRININHIYYGRKLEQANIVLQHQDAIYVPFSRMWRVADFVSTLLSPIISVREAIFVYDRFR